MRKPAGHVAPRGHVPGGCPRRRGGGVPRRQAAYLNPSAPALAHGVGDGSPGRVDHGDEPHKAEVFHREIQLIRVELEAFGELFVREEEVAETCREGQGAVRAGDGGAAAAMLTRPPFPACPAGTVCGSLVLEQHKGLVEPT